MALLRHTRIECRPCPNKGLHPATITATPANAKSTASPADAGKALKGMTAAIAHINAANSPSSKTGGTFRLMAHLLGYARMALALGSFVRKKDRPDRWLRIQTKNSPNYPFAYLFVALATNYACIYPALSDHAAA